MAANPFGGPPPPFMGQQQQGAPGPFFPPPFQVACSSLRSSSLLSTWTLNVCSPCPPNMCLTCSLPCAPHAPQKCDPQAQWYATHALQPSAPHAPHICSTLFLRLVLHMLLKLTSTDFPKYTLNILLKLCPTCSQTCLPYFCQASALHAPKTGAPHQSTCF